MAACSLTREAGSGAGLARGTGGARAGSRLLPRRRDSDALRGGTRRSDPRCRHGRPLRCALVLRPRGIPARAHPPAGAGSRHDVRDLPVADRSLPCPRRPGRAVPSPGRGSGNRSAGRTDAVLLPLRRLVHRLGPVHLPPRAPAPGGRHLPPADPRAQLGRRARRLAGRGRAAAGAAVRPGRARRGASHSARCALPAQGASAPARRIGCGRSWGAAAATSVPASRASSTSRGTASTACGTDSADHAVELVRTYLAAPAERTAIAEAGRRHTLAAHTYADRMRLLLEEQAYPIPERGGPQTRL